MEETQSELLKIRRDKLDELKKRGINPFAGRFEVTDHAQTIVDNFDDYEGKNVIIAGRLMAKRGHGKTSFANVMDMSGNIQIYLRKDVLGEEAFDVFSSLIDIGDIIGVEGEVFRTQKGEISVKGQKVTLLTKTLLPLPEKFHGTVWPSNK